MTLSAKATSATVVLILATIASALVTIEAFRYEPPGPGWLWLAGAVSFTPPIVGVAVYITWLTEGKDRTFTIGKPSIPTARVVEKGPNE